METTSYHVSLKEAETLLKKTSARFVQVMQDGHMNVEYFSPQNLDTQAPHRQDELYIIISGSSEFLRNEEFINCTVGDVIFVPAKMKHRFMNFSDDFATWVIFYGEAVN